MEHIIEVSYVSADESAVGVDYLYIRFPSKFSVTELAECNARQICPILDTLDHPVHLVIDLSLLGAYLPGGILHGLIRNKGRNDLVISHDNARDLVAFGAKEYIKSIANVLKKAIPVRLYREMRTTGNLQAALEVVHADCVTA